MIRISSLLLALLAIISFVSINFLNDSYKWLSHTYEVIGTIDKADRLLFESQNSVRGYVIGRREIFLEDYYRNHDKILPQLDYLSLLIKDNPRQITNVEELKKLFTVKLSRIDKNLALCYANNFDEASNHISSGRGEDVTKKIQEISEQMISVEKELLAARASNVYTNYTVSAYIIPIFLLISIVIVSIVSKSEN